MSRINIGQPAPNFSAITLAGAKLELSALRGQKVWLSFYRYARCPLCNLYLNFVISKWPFLQQHGVRVIAVFESKPEKFPKHLGGYPTNSLDVISDSSKQLYQKFGVEKKVRSLLHPNVLLKLARALIKGFPQPLAPDGELGSIPAHFLIDELGLVKDSYYGSNPADNIPWERVQSFASGGEEARPGRVALNT